MSTTFIGIDLAWAPDGKNTGIVVLQGDRRGARLVSTAEGINSLASITEFVRAHSTASTVVAVDAPLVVTNRTGSRSCEREIGRRYGRFHASCHSTNLARSPQQAGVRLIRSLEPYGFTHDFAIETARERKGRWLFEVYPHPAMVVLFELERIIRYKKGRVAQKRAGLAELQRHLRGLTARSRGLIGSRELTALLGQDLAPLRGEALKKYEDTLDALFCAYLAWHCWRWGQERNEVFGDLRHGYIVVPKTANQ